MSEPTQNPAAEPPPRIEEAARRRPGFDPATGAWIALDDGQEWLFPRPRVRVHYAGTGAGYVRRGTMPGRATFDPEFGRLLDASQSPDLPGPGRIAAQLGLAAYMLRVNYELSDDELGGLLSVDPYQDEGNDAFTAWLSVALGIDAPKTSGGDGLVAV